MKLKVIAQFLFLLTALSCHKSDDPKADSQPVVETEIMRLGRILTEKSDPNKKNISLIVSESSSLLITAEEVDRVESIIKTGTVFVDNSVYTIYVGKPAGGDYTLFVWSISNNKLKLVTYDIVKALQVDNTRREYFWEIK